jgi:hypothetical protein
MKFFATSLLTALIIASGWAGRAVADDQVNPFLEDEPAVVPEPAIEPGGDYCENSEVCKGCADNCVCGPCWSVEVDFLALQREHMDNVPIIAAGNRAVLLNADDINLSPEGGVRVAVARQLNACNDIEFEFSVIDDWTATVLTDVPGAQLVQFGATFGTNPFHLSYETDLYNTELNWRRSWFCDQIKSIVGFRWIELGEKSRVRDANSPPAIFVGDVDNHLYGFQIGMEAVALKWCRLEIEFGMKAGIYYNMADVDLEYPQDGAGASSRAKGSNTAFTGELMLGGSYCLTDCLSIRAGYQVLWIEGVAILPEQLDDLAVPLAGEPDLGGSPVYHGAYVGLEMGF